MAHPLAAADLRLLAAADLRLLAAADLRLLAAAAVADCCRAVDRPNRLLRTVCGRLHSPSVLPANRGWTV
jgi:hypothetical protein